MNVNFFQWLRDGVRQSVLLGLSDAVEQIGLPNEDAAEMKPEIAALFQTESDKKPRRRSNGRKRLGKSLKDMEPVEAKK